MNFSELAEGKIPTALAGFATNGHFIDMYSAQWLSNCSNKNLSLTAVQQLRDDCGAEIFHHLHVLFVEDAPEKKATLVQVIPELHWQFGTNGHAPDFVFFNVREELILSVGLGRKNRLFAFDSNKDNQLIVDFMEPQASCTDALMIRFVRLDYYGFVWRICAALGNLGVGYFHDQPEKVIAARDVIRCFFPSVDTRALNTHDY